MMITLCLCIPAIMLSPQSPWTVDYLSPPDGAILEVGGIGFMSDGALIASTRRGQVWRVDNPHAENPNDATFSLICEGLHEGLGLTVRDDDIYVMQRGEVSRLVDLDGDFIIDEIQTITQDWGMTGNYHEFGFGLPMKEDGTMYASFNLGFWNPQWWHGKSRAPQRGWIVEIAPNGTVTPYAGGLRSPAGLGLLEDGTVLVTDNQGDWMPVCPVFAVQKGGFYGHPASLRWFEGQLDVEPSDTQPPTIEREHPILWIPYQWSRSTGNIIQDKTGGKFGPFENQYFIAELTNGQILRATFETIDGVMQGACWLSTTRVGSAYHIEFGPDGTMYAGMTNRGWGGLAPGHGIARIKYNGELPLEMHDAHLLEDGFEITFTKPLAATPQIRAIKYDYNWWWEYGSPQQHIEPLELVQSSLSNDGKTLAIQLEGLEAGKCVHLTFQNAMSTDGDGLLQNEMSYTINKMPGGELAYVAKVAEPPVERGQRVEGWLYLSWADAFDMWENDGVYTCNAELDRNNPTMFVTSEGNGALVAHQGNSMTTKFPLIDGEFRCNFMLAENAKGIVELPIGVDVLLSDSETGLTGSIVDKSTNKVHIAMANGYLGAGIWHTLIVKYDATPKKVEFIELNGVIVVQDTAIGGESSPAPIRILSKEGNLAFGDVRVKQMDDELGVDGWQPLEIGSDWVADGGVNVWIEDGGTIVIDGGVGTAETTVKLHGATSLRFDAKIQGIGHSIIQIGDFAFDISTNGDHKTGGLQTHPISANLIDQDEWCTIEVRLGKSGWTDHPDNFVESTIVRSNYPTLLLNDIPIFNHSELTLDGNRIQVTHRDAKIKLRRLYIK